jgi:hypothetical protein
MRIACWVVLGVLILNPRSAKVNGLRRAHPVSELFAMQGNPPAREHAVTLNWKPSRVGVTGYNVYEVQATKTTFRKSISLSYLSVDV